MITEITGLNYKLLFSYPSSNEETDPSSSRTQGKTLFKSLSIWTLVCLNLVDFYKKNTSLVEGLTRVIVLIRDHLVPQN